uniref:Uncharacterized protein n=1 Tax=Rhizophora mucronata TaxID=61149 RepID=A0A2P2PN47_RHIMU
MKLNEHRHPVLLLFQDNGISDTCKTRKLWTRGGSSEIYWH